jgi:hypothetical protein
MYYEKKLKKFGDGNNSIKKHHLFLLKSLKKWAYGLHRKPQALKRGLNFTFSFYGTILAVWIRLPNPDPDLLTHYNLDSIRVRIRNTSSYLSYFHVRNLRTGLTSILPSVVVSQLFFTVPVRIFEKLRFRFRIQTIKKHS